jgi:putative transposase
MEQVSSLFTSLLEAQRAQAFERFTIIHPAIEEVITPAAVAYTHHIPLRTILGRIKNYGAQGLADLVRVDKGTSRSFPQTTIRLIEGLALQRPPHSAVSIHQQVTTIATEQSWNSSGYASVCQIIKDLESALVILVYEGGETNWEGFEFLYRIEATHTNPRWQADYTPLAIWLLNEEGKLAKPWLTIIKDDYSRAVASFPLTFQILTVLTTVLTLCQVVIQGYP